MLTPFARPWWHRYAACRGVDPALFFPERGDSLADAKATCAACPVRRHCEAFGIDNAERHGIWGGLSERERARIRRERARERADFSDNPRARTRPDPDPPGGFAMHDLITRLRADGHEVLLADDGSVAVSSPWERAADRDLVDELRAHEDEARAYLVAERAAREAAHAVATSLDGPPDGFVRLRADGTIDLDGPPPAA